MQRNGRVLLLQRRFDILKKVKDYRNNHLNPSKVNLFYLSRNDFKQGKSISEVLAGLNIDKKDYENVLKICDDKGFELHLRCPTDSSFVKNYFNIGLLA